MIQTESLNEYFREALTEAMGRTATIMSPEVQVYVVRMLLDFSRAEHAFSGVDQGEKPVYALLLARALDSEPQEALRLYKQVGDSTLYQLGFFKGFSSKRAVNESYYQTVGETAYAFASNLSRPLGLNATLIYGELAERFLELVKVFNEMSVHGERNKESGSISTERLLSLMDSYSATNSPQVAEVLRRQGVNLGSGKKS